MRRLIAVLVAAVTLAGCTSDRSTHQVRTCKPTVWQSCPKGPKGPAQFRCYTGKQYPRAWRCGAGQGMNEPGKSGAW